MIITKKLMRQNRSAFLAKKNKAILLKKKEVAAAV